MIDAAARCWRNFWFAPTPLARLAAFRVVLVYLTFHDFWAYSWPIQRYTGQGYHAGSWRPLYAFEALGIGPIDAATAQWVFAVFCVACACALVGLFTRTACFIVAVLVLYWTAQVYSFGKAHHDKVAFAFAWMTLPFSPCGARLSIDAWIAQKRRVKLGRDPWDAPQRSAFALPPLRMTQVTIAIGYFFAGASKLAIIGPSWANGWTLQGIMASFEGELTALMLSNLWLCQLTSVLTLACQFLFPLVFVFTRSRWFFLPLAAGFHIVAWLSIETGPYMTLWLLLLVFLPLERLPTIIVDNLRGGVLRALWILAITLPFVVVHFVVWFGPHIPWWLGFAFVPPAIAFARLLFAPRDGDRAAATSSP